MWLVLCSANDHAAHWAYGELRRAGLAPLYMVAEDTLAMPLAFEHRIGERGVRTRLELAGGLVLDSNVIQGVLNRITAVPAHHVYCALPAERDYALMELNALWVSWLHALPAPILNRPKPLGLCGAVRHVSEWRAMAAAVGLDAAPFRLADDNPAALHSPWDDVVLPGSRAVGAALTSELDRRTVLVVQDEVVGDDVPERVREGCVGLARSAGLGLMGAEFEVSGGGWRFLDATPRPDLRQGGSALIAALLSSLTSEAA